MDSIRYSADRGALVLGRQKRSAVVHHDGASSFFAHIDDIRAVSATGLRHALLAAERAWGLESGLLIATGDHADFDEASSLASPVSLDLNEGALVIRIIAQNTGYQGDHELKAWGGATNRTPSRANTQPNR